jgi:hypothetical protein
MDNVFMQKTPANGWRKQPTLLSTQGPLRVQATLQSFLGNLVFIIAESNEQLVLWGFCAQSRLAAAESWVPPEVSARQGAVRWTAARSNSSLTGSLMFTSLSIADAFFSDELRSE